MVALLPTNIPTKGREEEDGKPQYENRVVSVLMRRLGSSRTFGENLIFMLNRAGNVLSMFTLSRVLTWDFRAFTRRPLYATARVEASLHPVHNTGDF